MIKQISDPKYTGIQLSWTMAIMDAIAVNRPTRKTSQDHLRHEVAAMHSMNREELALLIPPFLETSRKAFVFEGTQSIGESRK